MNDDRIIEAHEFMNDDNFIKYDEFKSFLFKIKQNELALKMKLGDSDKVVARLVQNYKNMIMPVKSSLLKKQETW